MYGRNKFSPMLDDGGVEEVDVLLSHEDAPYRRKSAPSRISLTVYYLQGMCVSPPLAHKLFPDVLSPLRGMRRGKFIRGNLVPKSGAPPPPPPRVLYRVYHGYVRRIEIIVRSGRIFIPRSGECRIKTGVYNVKFIRVNNA